MYVWLLLSGNEQTKKCLNFQNRDGVSMLFGVAIFLVKHALISETLNATGYNIVTFPLCFNSKSKHMLLHVTKVFCL